MQIARNTPNFEKKVTVVKNMSTHAAVKVVAAADTTEIPISVRECVTRPCRPEELVAWL